MKVRLQIGCLFAVLLAQVANLSACTIPVFRYALDRWPADPYGIAVNDKWARSEAGEALLEELGDLAYRFQLVPDDKKAPGEIDLLMPAHGVEPLWSGKASAAELKAMASSPARKAVAEGILNGNSAVWVVVRSGDKERDSEFVERLKNRLQYLESVAAIPEQDPFDPESRLGPGPELRVGFKLVVVDRGLKAEQIFVRMLAGDKGEGLLKAGTPFAAPIFGRGRVLGAFTAEELDDEGIDEVCLFLLGACSCQVKAQNPGWDLLMDTDWDTELMRVAMALGKEAETFPAEKETQMEPELVVFDDEWEGVAPEGGRLTGPAREMVLGLGLVALVALWMGWKESH